MGRIPRMMTYLIEQDFAPVLIDDETYVPSGAVKSSAFVGNAYNEVKSDGKFCSECGTSLSMTAKFCPEMWYNTRIRKIIFLILCSSSTLCAEF